MTRETLAPTKEQIEELNRLTCFFTDQVSSIMGRSMHVVCVSHAVHNQGDKCGGTVVMSEMTDVTKVFALLLQATMVVHPNSQVHIQSEETKH